MRCARIKILDSSAYYHVGNHVCGPVESLPFTNKDKQLGFDLLKKLSRLFFVEVISACWMGNHFHLVLYVPEKAPSLIKVVERYNSYYDQHSTYHHLLDLKTEPVRCQKISDKLVDLSEFMKAFQQQYTFIFNRRHRRKGPLWRDRFWSTVLEGQKALWECVKYIELNPVRAGIVSDPAEYSFSSWGISHHRGQHPFNESFITHMRRNRIYADFTRTWTYDDEALFKDFKNEMNQIILRESTESVNVNSHFTKEMSRIEPVLFDQLLNRTRQWRSGLIIGSRQFVETTALGFYSLNDFQKKKKGGGITFQGDEIYCYNFGRISCSE